jgi:hypothetical protein
MFCRAEDGTEQRQTQSRGRNAKQRQAQSHAVTERQQTIHIQNKHSRFYKLGSSIEITKRNWVGIKQERS